MLPSKNLLKLAEYGNSDYDETPPAHSTPNPRTRKNVFNLDSDTSPVRCTPLRSYKREPPFKSNSNLFCSRKHGRAGGNKINPDQRPIVPRPILKLRPQNKVSLRYEEPRTLTTPEIEAAIKSYPKYLHRNSSILMENNFEHPSRDVVPKRRRSSRRKSCKSSFHCPQNDSSRSFDASSSIEPNKPSCPKCGVQRSSHKIIARHYNTKHKKVRLHCPWCKKLYALSYIDKHLKDVKCYEQFEFSTLSMKWDSKI